MNLKRYNSAAMAPFEEMVEWVQDASPHKRGSFRAVVNEGEDQSTSAGHTLDAVTAWPWTVRVNPVVATLAEIKVGDVINLLDRERTSLTIQQITPAASGWRIRCTSNMRAPNG